MKEIKLFKYINTYFGNAYVRYFVLFSWCKNFPCNNIKWNNIVFCNLYDLWFHEFVMLKPTLHNQTTPDSLLILEFIINYQGFFQAVWFTNVYQMKIEFSINLVQSHLKPTPMVLTEVSESFLLQKRFMGKKVFNCM